MLIKIINKYKLLPVQIQASFWFFVCAFLQKGVSVLTTPIFTRLLTTTEYGQYSVFNSWLGITSVFVSLNLYYGVYVQGLVKFEDEKKAYSSSLQGLCLTLVLLWTIIYLLFHEFWNNIFSLTSLQSLCMLVLIWTTAVFNFWSVEQRVNYNYRELIVITIIVSIVKPVLGIFLVLNADDKVTARILGLAVVELIVYIRFFFRQMVEGRVFYQNKFWKYALQFNIPLLPHYLSTSVLNGADRIMIKKMVGDDVAGIYSLAYSISLLMTMFNTALLQTLEPWMYKKIKYKQTQDISRITYPALIIIAVVNLILIAFAPEVVSIFAPPEYCDAIWVIPPVTMSVYFMFAYSFFAVYEFYYEQTHYIAIATMSGALGNIVLNYIFINIFGYYAAGYTTLICYIIYTVLHYCFMRKISSKYLNNKQNYNTKMVLVISICFVLLGFVFLITYYNVVLRYCVIFIVTIGVYIKRGYIKESLQTMIQVKKGIDIHP